jgi:hypothetical protein
VEAGKVSRASAVNPTTESVAEFLARGGRIIRCELGQSGEVKHAPGRALKPNADVPKRKSCHRKAKTNDSPGVGRPDKVLRETVRTRATRLDQASLIGLDDAPCRRHSGREPRTNFPKGWDLRPIGFPPHAGISDPESELHNGQPEPKLTGDEQDDLHHMRDAARNWQCVRVSQAGSIRALQGVTPPKPPSPGGTQGAEVIQPTRSKWFDKDSDRGEWMYAAGRDAISDLPYGAALAGTPEWFTLDHLLLAVIDQKPATALAKLCGKSDVAVARVLQAAMDRMEDAQQELATGNRRLREWLSDDMRFALPRRPDDFAVLRSALHWENTPHIVWMGNAAARKALQRDPRNPGKNDASRFRAVLAGRNADSERARAGGVAAASRAAQRLRHGDHSWIVGAAAFGPPRLGATIRHRSSGDDKGAPPLASKVTLGSSERVTSNTGFRSMTRSLLSTKYKVARRRLTAPEVAQKFQAT